MAEPQPTIALTFDDGPHPVWTPRILAALDAAGARATFFVCAPAAVAHPDVIESISGDGHEIGFHCYHHVRHSFQTRHGVEADTARGLEALRGLGVEPRLWRTPWGDLAPFTSELARMSELALIGWSEDTHDWRGDTVAEMLAAVEPTLGDGSVVLMHDGLGPGARRAGCGETEALIPALVELARGRGLEPGAIRSPGGPANENAGHQENPPSLQGAG